MRLPLIALMGFFAPFGRPIAIDLAFRADATCQGSACLNIYNVRVGTRCNTSDSIEADFSNDSNSLYLRGYVVFNTPKGKFYVTTNLMKPGQKISGPAYVCHGSGTPIGIANTGSDPNHLPYPDQR